MENKSRIYSLLAVGVVVISFSGILIKLSTAPPLITAFYRMFFSSLILTPILVIKHRQELKLFFDYRPALVGFFLAVHFYLWISAFEYTDVANAVIFIALQPLFTYLMEFLFAREDIYKGILFGIITAFIGSVIISVGSINVMFDKLWGDLLAVAAALFAGIYLFLGRSLREEVDYLPYLYIVYTYAALFLGLFTLVQGISFTGHIEGNLLYFLGLAVGPTLVGHSVLNYSVRFLTTTIVSLTILAEPVITTFLAYILLGEVVSVITIVGAVFIMVGIYQATMTARKREKVVEV
ncbi:MAG: DMT family transporter [Halothermotrichaceae bacterium]